jgi:hypothetical protein
VFFLYIKRIARGFKRLGRIVFFIKKIIKYHILLLLDLYKVCVGAWNENFTLIKQKHITIIDGVIWYFYKSSLIIIKFKRG